MALRAWFRPPWNVLTIFVAVALLSSALADPGASLLAESEWAMRARRRWKIRLQPVERGYAGRRAVALYRASPAEEEKPDAEPD